MRPLLLLLLCAALVGCGGATAAATPAPPSATGALNAMDDAGLPVYYLEGQTLTCAVTTGLLEYREFALRDLPNEPRHAVVSYDTPQHAEDARAACSKGVGNLSPTTGAWRRSTVILVWRFTQGNDNWHPYFSVLQAVR
jgi:hypothetical protein